VVGEAYRNETKDKIYSRSRSLSKNRSHKQILGASMHFYKRLRPLVGPLVRPLVPILLCHRRARACWSFALVEACQAFGIVEFLDLFKNFSYKLFDCVETACSRTTLYTAFKVLSIEQRYVHRIEYIHNFNRNGTKIITKINHDVLLGTFRVRL
jgi:hypothetical protein